MSVVPTLRVFRGFTQIPNYYLEALCQVKLSPNETKVLAFLIRKIIGWHKEEDRIPGSQFCKALSLDRRNIFRATRGLERKEMLVVTGDDKKAKIYRLQMDVTKWRCARNALAKGTPHNVIVTDDKMSSKLTTSRSSKLTHSKESTLKKDKIASTNSALEMFRTEILGQGKPNPDEQHDLISLQTQMIISGLYSDDEICSFKGKSLDALKAIHKARVVRSIGKNGTND